MGHGYPRQHACFSDSGCLTEVVEPGRLHAKEALGISGSNLGENLSRKDFCRNPRRNFANEFPGEFCRGSFFFVDFLGLFSWKKQEVKIHPKSTAKFKSEFLGVLRPKSTLQESALEILGNFVSNFAVSFSGNCIQQKGDLNTEDKTILRLIRGSLWSVSLIYCIALGV